MKRGTFLVFILLCIMALRLSLTQAQVIINLQLPPPGQFNPEHFTQMVVFNNLNPGPVQVSMVGTVEEETAGLIFNGSTGVFQLPPGFYNPHYSVYEPVDIEYIDADYEQFVITTNNLPPGNYVFCIRVFDANIGDELGFQCVPHSVFQPSAPMLIYPIDGSHVPEPFPVFTWLSPAPMPPVEMHYRFTLVEVFADQSPYEALHTNPPFFTDYEVLSGVYPYPAYAPPLQPDRMYVWRVQALMGQGIPVGENNGYSETGFFFAGDETMPGPPFESLPLVHCVIENYTFLLPEDVCLQLEGRLWDGEFLKRDYLNDEQQSLIDQIHTGLGLLTLRGQEGLMDVLKQKWDEVIDWNFELDPDSPEILVSKPSSGGAFMPIVITGSRFKNEGDKPIIPPNIYTGAWALSDTLTMLAGIISYPHASDPVMAWLTATHIFDQPGEFDARADLVLNDYFYLINTIELNLDTAKPGQWEIQLKVVFGDRSQASFSTFVDFPSHDMVMATDDQVSEMFSLAYSYYDRRWRLINDHIAELWDEMRRKRQELEDIYALWGFLEEQNRIIDRIPRIYGPRVRGIMDEMDKLPQNPDVPTDEDIADLEVAVNQAGSEKDDCEKRVKELEEKITKLEKEAEDVKQEQLDAMEERHQIYMQYGWTGSYGFRDTDRHGGYGEGSGAHWGYVGTPGNGPAYGTPDEARLFELQQKARKARKEWRKKRESIDRLKEELENAKKECDKLRDKETGLEQELADARDAQAQQQAHDTQQALLESQLEDICREIRAMLEALAKWCKESPGQCTFDGEIESLMKDCPPENWDAYWQKFRDLIAKKKVLEESLERNAKRVQDEIDRINDDIKKANDEANALLQAERQERERAERARKEAVASAKAAEEQKAKELRDCLEKFAKWVADNEQYLKRGNMEVLEKILDGATAAGGVAGGAAGAAAGGKPMGPAIGSALAQSLFNLGVSIFYAWVGDKATTAVKKIADRHVLQLIAASLIGDKRKCGVIKTDGATSYFFFKDGNRTIVFRISASFGLECLGEE